MAYKLQQSQSSLRTQHFLPIHINNSDSFLAGTTTEIVFPKIISQSDMWSEAETQSVSSEKPGKQKAVLPYSWESPQYQEEKIHTCAPCTIT